MNMFSSGPKCREKERNEQAQDGGRASAPDELEIWAAQAKTETENFGVDVRSLQETGCGESVR